MKYRDLAEEIVDYVVLQEDQGSDTSRSENLYDIEGIIEDFMRKQEYFASE